MNDNQSIFLKDTEGSFMSKRVIEITNATINLLKTNQNASCKQLKLYFTYNIKYIKLKFLLNKSTVTCKVYSSKYSIKHFLFSLRRPCAAYVNNQQPKNSY
jgi:hypothetical protein